jgi:CDP-diacylglycerol--glycerol-3-phosphate 3-phosphatidyltransferase/archaetidylinositol phosphate synthase
MIPILARFRQSYERVTLPLGQACIRLGLSADMLTYLSLAFSVLAGYLIAIELFWVGVLGILLVGLADMLDGATARASGTASLYGTVLDHVTDRYAEFFLLGGVMLSGAATASWVLFALFGMVMASYVRARAEATGKIASCNVGFAGRQEKLALLVAGLIAQPLAPQVRVLEWAVIAIGVASHITAAQRLRYTQRMLLSTDTKPDLRPGSGLV